MKEKIFKKMLDIPCARVYYVITKRKEKT